MEFKNLAIGTVATAPSPATSGTSLELGSGEGAYFSQPSTAGSFFVTASPPGQNPSFANSEILLVTARSSDTFTIVRAQSGSSAQSIAVGWTVFQGLYSEDVTTILDGWVRENRNWTRTGNHTFTVPGDVTATYQPWTKISYNDGSVDYGYILSSSHSAGTTTVNLVPNTSYVMAATTITAPRYSYQDNPQGFPSLMSYTCVFSSTSGSPSLGDGTMDSHFNLSRGICHTFIRFVVGSTTNLGTGQMKFSLPIAEATTMTMRSRGFGQLTDAATASYIAQPFMDAAGTGSNEIRIQYTATSATGTTTTTAPFTWGVGDNIEVQMIHKI